jgi:hypothetical protein
MKGHARRGRGNVRPLRSLVTQAILVDGLIGDKFLWRTLRGQRLADVGCCVVRADHPNGLPSDAVPTLPERARVFGSNVLQRRANRTGTAQRSPVGSQA